MKKLIIACLALSFTACTTVDDGTGTPDGGTTDAGGLQIDPPAESASWPCRSGVDADGKDYVEFRPGYLNNGTVDKAFIVGQADGEGIYGYYTGAYQQETKNASGWYRHYFTGPEGSTWVLTYGSCVDTAGNKPECWAQYGSSLSADAAGPFRWNSSGTNYACKGKRNVGKVATPLGAN
jgi:hypothetical protein